MLRSQQCIAELRRITLRTRNASKGATEALLCFAILYEWVKTISHRSSPALAMLEDVDSDGLKACRIKTLLTRRTGTCGIGHFATGETPIFGALLLLLQRQETYTPLSIYESSPFEDLPFGVAPSHEQRTTICDQYWSYRGTRLVAEAGISKKLLHAKAVQ